MSARLIHAFGEAVELQNQGRQVFRYVYEPATAKNESPKPYFHPMRTLAGNLVTICRPHDHPWHHGMAMTAGYVSGANFWGGPTFDPQALKYISKENHGRIQHRLWERMVCENDQIELTETLHWIDCEDHVLLEETRHLTMEEINVADGYWSLSFCTQLTNVSGRELRFGSPTTEGRPLAGYGGLFWRGPRAFQHGAILAEGDREGPEVMGQTAAWLAFIGKHDENHDESTILFLDHPANPRFPTKWFVRNDPYGCASCAFMFDEEYPLAANQQLSLRYLVVVADGAWPGDRVESFRTRQGWLNG